MDLAKIRKKSRQERDEAASDSLTVQSESLPGAEAARPVMTGAPPGLPAAEPDVLRDQYDVILLQQHRTHIQPPTRDPLKVLMAGREAAGLDGDVMVAVGETVPVEESTNLGKYLCFKVADEVYGISIMDIKEIIRPRDVTEIPRAPSFVSGIISLRGTIIPILDMQDRLGLQRERLTGRERVVVVKNSESFSGLYVDEIIRVAAIDRDCIEAAPTVLEGIDRDFVAGIGRTDGSMIIILNLDNITDLTLY